MPSKVELVQKVLGAVATGDTQTAMEHVSPDFVWHVPGTSPASGDVHGVHEWGEKLRTLIGAGLRPQVLAALEGEHHVAFLQRNVAESGDRRLDVQVMTLFTLEDGKVARMDSFFGDQPAAESFWNGVLGG